MQVNRWARKRAGMVLNEQRCQMDRLRQRQIPKAAIGLALIRAELHVADYVR